MLLTYFSIGACVAFFLIALVGRSLQRRHPGIGLGNPVPIHSLARGVFGLLGGIIAIVVIVLGWKAYFKTIYGNLTDGPSITR
jgi:hypothetical protein